MKATEKWGGKVRTGGDESGRLRGSGARREAGEPVCQALTWVSQTSHVTDTQTHTHMRTSLSRSTVSYWHYRAEKAARRRDAPHSVSQFDRRPGSSTLRLAGWLAGCAAGTQLLSH